MPPALSFGWVGRGVCRFCCSLSVRERRRFALHPTRRFALDQTRELRPLDPGSQDTSPEPEASLVFRHPLGSWPTGLVAPLHARVFLRHAVKTLLPAWVAALVPRTGLLPD
ncbi:hypothetical protein Afil01_58710 [Actinorhabdospora filicis]|uniref:Uncharacterized protein n=1 Tax=Actinorhabdospora filicis TaxID=1785913 RepID=A0A9W6WBX1_9ACTN|nr:hypothetical protein Afil01_58710 [Actinorhabdospora filicis]